MYVKYKEPLTGTEQIRDVRHFKIRPQDCIETDDTVTHGAVICDGMVERAAFYGGAVVGELAGLILDSGAEVGRRRHRTNDPVATVDGAYVDLPECEELMWFNSWAAAQAVMDELCRAISAGGRLFDLTRYGEDGEAER